MRKIRNTCYIVDSDAYASLENENIVVWVGDDAPQKNPLSVFEQVFCFSRRGMSAALIAECLSRDIGVALFDPNGKFLYRPVGKERGNVLLRKQQYRISEGQVSSCRIARHMIYGKILNCKCVINRIIRDHGVRLDTEGMCCAVDFLAEGANNARICDDLDSLRGIEGKCADMYFSVFDQMILNQKDDFFFHKRSRRPPMDRVNAMLSFGYSILEHSCASALCGVGLDPYVGFLHRDRPGRESLACDLMEELRPVFVDKLVLTLVNNRQISPKDFEEQADGAVLLSDSGRKKFLTAWHKRKYDRITHPFLEEKLEWGLVPYAQALLLTRTLRGDIDIYPPFLWK